MLLEYPHGTAQAEGTCGHTLWSCGGLSPRVFNVTQKTDPREDDHESRRLCSLRSVFCSSGKKIYIERPGGLWVGRRVERTSMRGLRNREREERTEKCKL